MPIPGDAERSVPHSRWSEPWRTARRAQRSLAGRVPHPGSASGAATAPRPNPANARDDGRIAMIETKAGEPLVFSPLEDEPVIENLPEPIPLTPEQMRAQAEADERDRQRQLEWAMVVQALNDNSLAVVRAMRRFRNET